MGTLPFEHLTCINSINNRSYELFNKEIKLSIIITKSVFINVIKDTKIQLQTISVYVYMFFFYIIIRFGATFFALNNYCLLTF